MNNSIIAEEVNKPSKPRFSVAISTPQYKKLISDTLSDPARCTRFVSAITSAVAVSSALQDCTPQTIIAGALLGEGLNLSPSPQLGQYYLVPFETTVKDANGNVVYILDENGNKIKDAKGKWMKQTVKQAQFVLGYKGYIQLAIRSGYYKHISVLEVKDGEFVSYNPFTEDFSAQWIVDPGARAKARTVGYVAMFEYLNGFKKLLYWTKEQMLLHADTYSKAFSADTMVKIENGEIPAEDMWRYSSFWYKDFDGMAKKTMIRQLISHWGVMSTEMQAAFERDQSIADVADGNKLVFGSAEAVEETEYPAEISTPMEKAQESVETHEETAQVSMDEL